MKTQKQEIIYKIVNSLLAGVLVFLGTCVDGELTLKGMGISVAASLIIAITKFKEYWDGEESEYSNRLFTFLK